MSRKMSGLFYSDHHDGLASCLIALTRNKGNNKNR